MPSASLKNPRRFSSGLAPRKLGGYAGESARALDATMAPDEPTERGQSMDQRTGKIVFFLTVAAFAGMTSGLSLAQDKPQAETKAPARKAAEHATTGDETNAGNTTHTGLKPGATWPGMTRAGTVLLPNGWSLKPAGRQSKLGDLPIQIAVHPSQSILAILHAGYGEHEIVTVDGSNGKIIGRVSLPASFAGLLWSADGKRLFAGGGFDDRIYRFDHADGPAVEEDRLRVSRPRKSDGSDES